MMLPSEVRSSGAPVALSMTEKLERTGGPGGTLLIDSLQPPIKPRLVRHRTISGARRQNSLFMESSFTLRMSLRDGRHHQWGGIVPFFNARGKRRLVAYLAL